MLHGRHRLRQVGQAEVPDQHHPLLEQRGHHQKKRTSLPAGKKKEPILTYVTFPNLTYKSLLYIIEFHNLTK